MSLVQSRLGAPSFFNRFKSLPEASTPKYSIKSSAVTNRADSQLPPFDQTRPAYRRSGSRPACVRAGQPQPSHRFPDRSSTRSRLRRGTWKVNPTGFGSRKVRFDMVAYVCLAKRSFPFSDGNTQISSAVLTHSFANITARFGDATSAVATYYSRRSVYPSERGRKLTQDGTQTRISFDVSAAPSASRAETRTR